MALGNLYLCKQVCIVLMINHCCINQHRLFRMNIAVFYSAVKRIPSAELTQREGVRLVI